MNLNTPLKDPKGNPIRMSAEDDTEFLLGDLLYQALTNSNKALKGSASEKRTRGKLAARVAQEGPEVDFAEADMAVIRHDVEEICPAALLYAAEQALDTNA